VSVSEWNELESKLEDLGYQKHQYSYAYKEFESWMADRPTVLYYRDSAIPAAKRLAAQMEKMTGEHFVIQHGGGFGVDPGKEASTFLRASHKEEEVISADDRKFGARPRSSGSS